MVLVDQQFRRMGFFLSEHHQMNTQIVMVRGQGGRFTAGAKITETPLAADTREQWLNRALNLIRTYLVLNCAGAVVPQGTRISCGLAGGRIGSKRIGECWNTTASADGSTEIFISPVLDDVIGKSGVLATLVHEAIHAAVGVEHGHKKPFQRVAIAAGLVGKFTATEAGEALLLQIYDWAQYLGAYPHAHMNPAGRKKQSTRLVKVQCRNQECGYVLRTTAKWIDKVGAPICPCNDLQMTVESAESDEEGAD